MKQGELMWLPADIALLQFDEAGNVKKHKMTERPMNVFLVKTNVGINTFNLNHLGR